MNKGFSILEVVIAIGLVAMSTLALVGILTGVLRYSAQTNDSSMAVQAAQELLDRIKFGPVVLPDTATDFNGSANDPTQNDFPPQPYPHQEINGMQYSYKVHCEPVANQPALHSINIIVMWGDHHQVALDSYVFKP